MSTEDYEYVGFWARVGASLIDTVLMAIVVFPILLAVYGNSYLAGDEPIDGALNFLLSWVFPALAVIAFWIAKQATPGKMLVSAKIVDAKTGQAPSTGQLIGRYLAYYVSMIPLFLGFVWVAFDKQKQGWHDKLAGTLVVKSKD